MLEPRFIEPMLNNQMAYRPSPAVLSPLPALGSIETATIVVHLPPPNQRIITMPNVTAPLDTIDCPKCAHAIPVREVLSELDARKRARELDERARNLDLEAARKIDAERNKIEEEALRHIAMIFGMMDPAVLGYAGGPHEH